MASELVNYTDAYCFTLLLLCIWREARGEILDAKIAVGWSIRNRAIKPSWWGNGWDGVILHPFQYSSFNANDPNASKIPYVNDVSFLDCEQAAHEAFVGQGTDPTFGATHYFDKCLDASPPKWVTDGSMVHLCNIGGLRFYKQK